MKFSLLATVLTAASALAAPAPAPVAEAAPTTDFDLVSREPIASITLNGTETDTELSKRWAASWFGPGEVWCGGHWWEYGQKRIWIQWTGLTEVPDEWRTLFDWPGHRDMNNRQYWKRSDNGHWEINFSFPDWQTENMISQMAWGFDGLQCSGWR